MAEDPGVEGIATGGGVQSTPYDGPSEISKSVLLAMKHTSSV